MYRPFFQAKCMTRSRNTVVSLPLHFASSIGTRVHSAVPVDLPSRWNFPSVIAMPIVPLMTSWQGMRWMVRSTPSMACASKSTVVAVLPGAGIA
jgi:hypothetical protein